MRDDEDEEGEELAHYDVGRNAFVLVKTYFDEVKKSAKHKDIEDGVIELEESYMCFNTGVRLYLSKPLPLIPANPVDEFSVAEIEESLKKRGIGIFPLAFSFTYMPKPVDNLKDK